MSAYIRLHICNLIYHRRQQRPGNALALDSSAQELVQEALESATQSVVDARLALKARCMCAGCWSVLQCVAVCCSVLQCVVDARLSLKVVVCAQGVAECCSVSQCVAVCCTVLQCVAVCCCVLQCCNMMRLAQDTLQSSTQSVLHARLLLRVRSTMYCSVLQGVARCCRVLQGVAGCCRVLRGVAGCCSVLQ